MEFRNEPHFIIKKNFQKSRVTGRFFSDAVTEDVLRDICFRIVGAVGFTFEYVGDDYQNEFLGATYNKGRMAIMLYRDVVSYISFSEQEVGGRNSSIQSVPTAFNLFYNNPYPKKKLYFYFLNTSEGVQTEYQILVYRLMSTVGFEFLNASDALEQRIHAFNSVKDIMFNRRINAGRNKSNNSTFITKGESGTIEVYGKTYGANKYETSLICYALAYLCQHGQTIKLYEVLEGNLKELPESSLNVIRQMGVIEVIPTDMTLEKKLYAQSNSLRSPRYTYNLFNKLGNKHCALCNCEIPELIHGAHIWPVANIKRYPSMTAEKKLECALDGENGLWLCENHHKMFDEHLLTFDQNGRVQFRNDIDHKYITYMDEITTSRTLPRVILTNRFLEYLWRRNQAV